MKQIFRWLNLFFYTFLLILFYNKRFLMVDIQTNPLYFAAIGGIILGIATSLHYALKGNVTGMSGILNDVIFFNKVQMPCKLTIIGGIILTSGVFFDIFGYQTYNGFTPFGPKDQISSRTSFLGYALAGLLVGFGTKLGNGCTSGHGLCGLARLSIRSLVAVLVFLASAIAISTLRLYATLGPFSQNFSPSIQYVHLISSNLCIFFGFMCFCVGFSIDKIYNRQIQQMATILRDHLISLSVGLIFGAGLVVAGMARRKNIMGFLEMGTDWNPSLLFVLGCGVVFNLIVFNYMIRIRKVPYFAEKLFNPESTLVDSKLVLGAFCFGIGWGIGGLCPGPVLALLPVFQVQIHVIWFSAFVLGTYLAIRLLQISQQNKKEKIKQNAGLNNNQTNRVENSAVAPELRVEGANLSPIKGIKSLSPLKKIEDRQAYDLDNLAAQNSNSEANLIEKLRKQELQVFDNFKVIQIGEEEMIGQSQ